MAHILAFAVAVLLCAGLCAAQNPTFGASLPLTSSSESELASIIAQATLLGIQQANQNFDQAGGAGILASRNISLTVLDNQGSSQTLISQLQQLTTSPNFLGIIGSVPTQDQQITQRITSAGGIFFNPGGVSPALRTPFTSHVINIRPSPADEATAIVSTLALKFQLSRIAIIYQNDADPSFTDYGVPAYTAAVSALSLLGLRPVTVASVSSLAGDPVSQWSQAAASVATALPQAVMIFAPAWVVGNVTSALHQQQLLPSGTVIAAGSRAADTGLDRYIPPAVLSSYAVYGVHFVPPLSASSNSLVAAFTAAASAMSPSLLATAQLGGGRDFIALGAYIGGCLAAAAVARAAAPPAGTALSTADLSAAVFGNPIYYIGGERIGPFSSDCSDTAVFRCCNQGPRTFYWFAVESDDMSTIKLTELPALQYTWSDACAALPDAADIARQIPVVFGQAVAAGDPIAAAMRDGINAAFAVKDAVGGFAGRPLYLVSFEDDGSAARVAADTQELLTANRVVGLAGYVGYTTVSAALDTADIRGENATLLVGMATGVTRGLREPFEKHILNVRASYRDEIAVIFEDLIARGGTPVSLAVFGEDSPAGRAVSSAISDALSTGSKYAGKITVSATQTYNPALNSDPTFGAGLQATIGAAIVRLGTAHAALVFATTNVTAEFAFQWRQSSGNANAAVYAMSYADAVELSITLEARGYFALVDGSAGDWLIRASSVVDNPNMTLAANSSNTALVAGYTSAMVAYAAANGRSWYPTAASFEGYLVGRFIVSAIERINGDITASTLATAVYATQVFNIDGHVLGPYSDQSCDATSAPCCNQGEHAVYLAVLAPANAAERKAPWSALVFDTCGVVFVPPREEENDSSSEAIDINTVVGVVVGVGGALLVAMAILAVVFIRRMRQAPGRRRLRTPQYEKLALAAAKETMARPRIEELLLEDLPILDARMQRNVLAKFEQIVLNLDNIKFLLHAFKKTPAEMGEVAHAVTFVYHHHARAVQLLLALAAHEIADTRRLGAHTTLFRQDNALSKMFKVFTKLVGLPFLFEALGEPMAEIEELSKTDQRNRERAKKMASGSTSYDDSTGSQAGLNNASGGSSSPNSRRSARGSSISLEIDPERMDKRDNQFVNAIQLRIAVQKLFNALRDTALRNSPHGPHGNRFPRELREFLHGLKLEMSSAQMDQHTSVALAGFAFLRYICPAITTPHQHGLFNENPTGRAQRFLVLLSKILQNLANGCQFEKEEYMKPLNDFIVENMAAMGELMVDIAEIDTGVASVAVQINDDLQERALIVLFHQVVQFKDKIMDVLVNEIETPKCGVPVEQLRDLQMSLPGVLSGTAVGL